MLIQRKPWMQEASCIEQSLDIFFPNRYTENTVSKPFSVCEQCSVRCECLYEAMTTESVGIWGKTTDYQRSVIMSRFFNDNPKNINIDTIFQIVENNNYSIPISLKYDQ